MSWKIFYSDKTSISSDKATPSSVDRRADVQVIVQESADHNWVTLSGYDYYLWDARGGSAKWWGGDHFGLDHYLLQPGQRCVLFGTHIDDDVFREIFDRAREELGDKVLFKRYERRP